MFAVLNGTFEQFEPIFVVVFLRWSQAICWYRVAPGSVTVDSFKESIGSFVVKSREDCALGWGFWDSIVTLMCCAGSRSFRS